MHNGYSKKAIIVQEDIYNLMKEVLHDCFGRSGDHLIAEAADVKYDSKLKRHKLSLFIRIATITACLFITVAIFFLNVIKRSGNNIEEGDIVNDSEYLLDSDVVNSGMPRKDIEDLINNFHQETIDEAFIFINAGTASGMAVKVTSDEDATHLTSLTSMVFNNEVVYTAAPSYYDSRGYSFYITYTDKKRHENYTAFVFDNETIRFDGLFLKASKPLDYDAVNSIIKSYPKKHLSGATCIVERCRMYDYKT